MEKKKYIVEVTETLSKQVVVEAESETEAYNLVEDAYNDAKIILYPEDNMDTEVTVVEKPVETLAANSATILFKNKDKCYLEVRHTSDNTYLWLLFNGWKTVKSGELVNAGDTLGTALPKALEAAGFKEEDVASKYNGSLAQNFYYAELN